MLFFHFFVKNTFKKLNLKVLNTKSRSKQSTPDQKHLNLPGDVPQSGGASSILTWPGKGKDRKGVLICNECANQNNPTNSFFFFFSEVTSRAPHTVLEDDPESLVHEDYDIEICEEILRIYGCQIPIEILYTIYRSPFFSCSNYSITV